MSKILATAQILVQKQPVLDYLFLEAHKFANWVKGNKLRQKAIVTHHQVHSSLQQARIDGLEPSTSEMLRKKFSVTSLFNI